MDLGADGPSGAGGGVCDGVDDELGGAGQVGEVDDFFGAFWVDEDLHGLGVGVEEFVVLVDLGAVFWGKEHVNAAMSCPQDGCGVV